MIQNKMNFLDYQFPNAGQFFSDPNCTNLLFIGQLEVINNKIYIKVLSSQEHYYNYGDTLYARLNTTYDPQKLTSYSFFGCSASGTPFTNNSIRFNSFIKHDNGNHAGIKNNKWKNNKDEKETPLPAFIDKKDTFTKLSVEFSNLDKWLWNLTAEESRSELYAKKPEFRAQYIDEKSNVHSGYWSDKGYIKTIKKMVIPFKSMRKTIKLDDNTTLVFISNPSVITAEFPNFYVNQSSHIEIISKEPHTINFFLDIIYKLKAFLSIITNSECKIYRIYFHKPGVFSSKGRSKPYKHIEFFDNRLGWDLDKDTLNSWFVGYNMTYRNIKKDLATSLKQFFDKYKDIHNLLSFLINAKQIQKTETVELFISNQIQLIEMYGNLKAKGNDNKTENNINSIISALPNEAFDKIFIHHYRSRNSIPCYEIFGCNSDTQVMESQEVKKFRKILKGNLMDLRNFITHPCKNGKFKNLKEEKIYRHWCDIDNNCLNRHAISCLSFCLTMVLRFFVLQEIGLENYWYKENL